MKKENRTIVYDDELQIEAYRLEGIVQSFPNHFHEHYMIGLIEGGKRRLSCKNKEYELKKGDIVILNPKDNHSCFQVGSEVLDYRGINIPQVVMLDLVEEITVQRQLPGFSSTVVHDPEITYYLRLIHELIIHDTNVNGYETYRKKEYLISLISLLLQNYGQPFEYCIPECREEIEKACTFIEQHFAERISLNQLCHYTGLSKSTLLRAFTKSKGITPYRYLETLRINEAKKLLEKGVPPIEAAIQTGFSDQSHFTNYFSSFIGLAPGVYYNLFCNKK